MLEKLIAFSLRNRFIVLAGSLGVAIWGALTASSMPIDVLPDLNRPTVTVMTEAHAMVPEDVERLITLPLEQTLNGATGVMRLRSSSGTGLSVVFVEFDWGADIYICRQIVQEKLQLAKVKLPPGIEPQMAPISSIMGQIQMIGIKSRNGATDIMELRSIADFNVKYRLLSIPGVAQVVIGGGAPRQLQVLMDADKLRAFDVTALEVAEAVRKANRSASGGVLNLGTKGPSVTVTGLVRSSEEIADAFVRHDVGRPVRISDVARVIFGPASVRIGEAGVDGGPGVVLVVFKQMGTDTVDLTRRIGIELEALKGSLGPDIEIIPDVFQQSAFIDRAIRNVEEAVRDGGILVFLVLIVFLMNARITFITLTAIPLSTALTVILFQHWGLTINTMTLGGLAVAIGTLVDDAIVGVENVFRRLRENAKASAPHSPFDVIYKASLEVRGPIVVGTLIVMVVYVPLFFLSGIEGKLFTPIGVTYIVSVACSMLVSLTVTPALSLMLLPKSRAILAGHETPVVRHLKSFAGKVIGFSLDHAKAIMVVLGVMVAVSIVLLLKRGTQFLPEFNEGTAQINLILPPETGLETSDQFGRRLEKALLGIKGVKHVGRRTGRSEGDEHAEGVGTSEAIVSLDPKSGRSREEVVEDIRAVLTENFPGVPTAVDQPLAHLISHMLSGVKAQVAVKIFGPDLETLRSLAADTEAALQPIPGVKDLMTEPQVMMDNIRINPDRTRLALRGLTVEDVAETVELAMGGEAVSQLASGQQLFPIVVGFEAKDRKNLDAIRAIRIRDSKGALVPLQDVAEVAVGKTPNNINREQVQRRIVVQHNVAGRSLGEVVADVRAALGGVQARIASLGGGYTLRISGQFEAQEEAQRRIALLSLASLAVMALILYMHFKSVGLSLQVMMSIPMAFVGAVAYIVADGQVVSIATLVGLIALGGMAARNTILLIDHYLHLMAHEGESFNRNMIMRAGQERMVPVMMTALASGIALVPIALTAGEPGREILYPVATVIIGGLASSTLLDFLVSPALFWLFGRAASEAHVMSLANKPDATGYDAGHPNPRSTP
ncbi:MAG: efflux RND transporter permease subunit [Planctomycetota bacterium]